MNALAGCRRPWWMLWRGHKWEFGTYTYRPEETETCPRCGLKRTRVGVPFPETWVYDASEKWA